MRLGAVGVGLDASEALEKLTLVLQLDPNPSSRTLILQVASPRQADSIRRSGLAETCEWQHLCCAGLARAAGQSVRFRRPDRRIASAWSRDATGVSASSMTGSGSSCKPGSAFQALRSHRDRRQPAPSRHGIGLTWCRRSPRAWRPVLVTAVRGRK